MDLVQAYETVVATRGRERGEIEFGFLSVPRRMIAESSLGLLNRSQTQVDWFNEMKLEADPIPVGRIVGAIFSLLAADDVQTARELFRKGPDEILQRAADDPELGLLAEYLAFGEVIPFEQSKLTSVAVATAAVGSATAVAGKSIPAITAAAAAPPVAFFVVAGLAGGVLVINGIGLIAGLRHQPQPQHQEARVRLLDRIRDRLLGGR